MPVEPQPRRPYMPGYGILPPEEGTGLLAWADVEPRLASSHDYWLATTWPDGRPHVMPVWGVWDGGALWFGSSGQSRKIANLRQDARCVATSDNPRDPVIVEGVAEIVTDIERISRFVALSNAKYDVEYAVEFYDPAVNSVVRVSARTAFALLETDFNGSPTRWTFAAS